MSGKARLPMGMGDFEQIRKEGFYYVDKTGMIRDLLENFAYVNLFTRPRRFGNTIILIDEYDVPLDKAYQAGYYDAMVDFIRNLFVQAFKTNGSLYFAMLTGCLRLSKESIFTGFS